MVAMAAHRQEPEPERDPEPGRENDHIARFHAQPAINIAINALAVEQHAILRLAHLDALGLGHRGSQLRAARGRLHRVHRGVYSTVPRELLTREGLWLAAVFACGDGAVLSHRSAAALHGLRPSGGTRIDVTVPGRSAGRCSGVRIHRSVTLTPADITIVNGIPCTTVARTLLDLAAVLPRRAVERACDQAEVLELFDLVAIEDQIARNPTSRGASTLQAILTEHYVGDTLTWSELEEAFLALTRRIGLPDARSNYFVELGDGEPPIRADFAWPRKRIAVETDGKRFHLTNRAFQTDRRRDQRLAVARWRAIRTTEHQIRFRPNEVEQTLQALYGYDA